MSRITNAKELGKLVRERRKARGMTQSDLAMYSNTGIRFISDLENGKPTIQIEKTITVLAMLALDVYVEER
ncbi:MAG: helix-turn-helix transcriptional regulator [Spirochaetales bacterium]|nr:helix-turn-helix transcriptional regulator [Spirochaetales bacterium]MBQ3830374.1 helix-turn-helix transcriptional regulator [Spirochaetales bacterium]MBQ4500560.1 helix-turn-helix transcriptional regulator [Spirochaetales bacterium]